ncbi:hypothetical protein NL676_018200 [Syzygium grande]|nr:hypothetical protein NL676_018200 [Syzygium grande]
MMSMSQLLHPLGAILFFDNAHDPRGRLFRWVPPKSGSYVSINAVFSRLFVGARSSSHGDFPPAGSNETSG